MRYNKKVLLFLGAIYGASVVSASSSTNPCGSTHAQTPGACIANPSSTNQDNTTLATLVVSVAKDATKQTLNVKLDGVLAENIHLDYNATREDLLNAVNEAKPFLENAFKRFCFFGPCSNQSKMNEPIYHLLAEEEELRFDLIETETDTCNIKIYTFGGEFKVSASKSNTVQDLIQKIKAEVDPEDKCLLRLCIGGQQLDVRTSISDLAHQLCHVSLVKSTYHQALLQHLLAILDNARECLTEAWANDKVIELYHRDSVVVTQGLVGTNMSKSKYEELKPTQQATLERVITQLKDLTTQMTEDEEEGFVNSVRWKDKADTEEVTYIKTGHDFKMGHEFSEWSTPTSWLIFNNDEYSLSLRPSMNDSLSLTPSMKSMNYKFKQRNATKLPPEVAVYLQKRYSPPAAPSGLDERFYLAT